VLDAHSDSKPRASAPVTRVLKISGSLNGPALTNISPIFTEFLLLQIT
jgi:hypothetical protein